MIERRICDNIKENDSCFDVWLFTLISDFLHKLIKIKITSICSQQDFLIIGFFVTCIMKYCSIMDFTLEDHFQVPFPGMVKEKKIQDRFEKKKEN